MRSRLSPLAVETWARFIRAEQHLLETVESDLKSAGLPPLVWYDVLLELVRTPDGRLRQKELQARMLLKKYNLSRLLDRMEAEKIVRRDPVDDDARGVDVAITDAGRKLQRKTWPVYERAIFVCFASRLDDDELAQLNGLLAKLRAP